MEEYKKTQPKGVQYSWFAHLYRQWSKKHDTWMPQFYKAGEQTFVDYSGLTVPIWSTNLQEKLYQAEIFVSVLGASDLVFCIASKSQNLADWIEAHCKMFEYYGGATELIVPDNLRSAVSKAHRYEPLCNRTYEEMARHYGCAIMPARAYKPRDKAKAEKSVQFVQQRILAALRDEQYTSIEALNQAILLHLEELNGRKFQKLEYSRRELFNKIERSILKPLPNNKYHIARWHKQKVNGGYHLCVDGCHYSVPYKVVHKVVEIRLSKNIVEVFYKDDRIACHQRSSTPGYTTVDAHRPESHRQKAMWQQAKLQEWAKSIGANTDLLIAKLFADTERHLYQKERSALGILRLSKSCDEAKLEIVCQQALELGTTRLDSITSLLKYHNNTNRHDVDSDYKTPIHENIRGSEYYH